MVRSMGTHIVRIWAGWIGLALCDVAVLPLFAEEIQPVSASSEDKAPLKSLDDPRLPPIPYQRLQELGTVQGAAPAVDAAHVTALGLSAEQRAKIGEISRTALRYDQALLRIRAQYDAPFNALQRMQLFQAAFEQMQTDRRAEATAAMSSVLTPEQRAVLRQRFRREAHEQQPGVPRSSFVFNDAERIRAATDSNDKLSLVSLISVQQSLELTDVQHLALLDLRALAVAAARRILESEIEAALTEGPTSMPAGPAWKLNEALSPEQARKFEEYVNALPGEKKVAIFGSTAIKARETNGVLSVEVTLGNPFENDPELRKVVGLDDEGMRKFKAFLTRSEEEMKASILANHAHKQRGEAAAKLRREQAHQPFLDEWNSRAIAILTPEQVARLGTQKWRSNPVFALLDTDLAKLLDLTEEQSAKIHKHLIENRPKPLDIPAIGGQVGIEAMQKRQEAFFAQGAAFIEEQRAAVSVLTPTQLAKFIELTGYQPLPPARQPFRPARPGSKPGDST